ncbi:MAG: efflux RND transporter periplasmic adaptor subunit [Verrucomicrobia bacterium]|nr:efflux RND transporter periplasmic adaptor subunit [Verrucomicrobiota bacterium]
MDPDKLNQLHIQTEAKSRPKSFFWATLLLVILVSGAAVYYAWPKKDEGRRIIGGATNKTATGSAAKMSEAKSTETRSLSKNDSVLTVSGYIVNRERIELSPRFMGVVKWIGVKKGDAVTNGQVVVLLDDAEQKARLHETEGRLANAKVAINKAELDYARVIELAKTKIETKKAEDDARLQLESARAALKETEGSYELAKTYLDWTVIRAPIDGVVLEKLVDPNELVVPQSFGGLRGPSTALIALADPKDLQVEIELNEADLSKIFLNQSCRVSPEAYPDKVYGGHVAEMAPEANRQKGTLQIKVQIHDPDHFLTPELSAKVDFLGGKTNVSEALRK